MAVERANETSRNHTSESTGQNDAQTLSTSELDSIAGGAILVKIPNIGGDVVSRSTSQRPVNSCSFGVERE